MTEADADPKSPDESATDPGAAEASEPVTVPELATESRGDTSLADEVQVADRKSVEVGKRKPLSRRVVAWLKKPLHAALALVLTAVVVALGAAVATPVTQAFCLHLRRACAPVDKINVVVDEDKVKDTNDQSVGGAYLVTSPRETWTAPPNDTDSCVGRWGWAHQELHAVDAITTVTDIDLRAGDKPITVVGIGLDIKSDGAPPAGSLLTCAGKGAGPRAGHQVDVDLDAQTLRETNDDGAIRNDIDAGQAATYHVAANTITCDCEWRLVFTIEADGVTHTETVGAGKAAWGPPAANADVPYFHTAGASVADSYRFLDHKWQKAAPNAPTPAPSGGACNLVPLDSVAVVLGGNPTATESRYPASIAGASGRTMHREACVWASASGDANLNVDSLTSTRDAQAEYRALTKTVLANAKHAEKPQSLSDLGDRAESILAENETFVVVLRKNQVISLVGAEGSQSHRVALDESYASRLARIAVKNL